MPTVAKQTARPKPRKGTNVIDRIEGLEEGLESGYKFNVYGPSGSGKTTFWATFPKPILAIICSGGKRAGELLSINTPAYRKTIQKVVLQSSGEVQQLTEHFGGTGKFKTFVLDHATGLQDLITKEVAGLDDLPEQKSWGLVSQQQYGQIALQAKERFRNLLDLPEHVVIVAQERVFNNEDNGSDVLQPFIASALQPSIVGWLNPACDYIVETFIRQKMEEKVVTVGDKKVTQFKPGKGVEFCLRTAPHSIYATKFRVPKGKPLPEVIINPTFDQVDKLIRGLQDQ